MCELALENESVAGNIKTHCTKIPPATCQEHGKALYLSGVP